MENQIKNSFDDVTIKKIVIGSCIAGGGAVLTYLLKLLTNTDFGEFTPIIVAVLSVFINAVREYLSGIDTSK